MSVDCGTILTAQTPAVGLHALAALDQHAARNLEAAVALLLERIERLPRHAVGVDDMNPEGDLAVGGARFAKFETLVAIDRRVAIAHDAQEYVGLRKALVDARRGIGVGSRRIVAGEGLDLRADDGLRGGDIVASCGWRYAHNQK